MSPSDTFQRRCVIRSDSYDPLRIDVHERHSLTGQGELAPVEQLEALGLTWERFEMLTWKALNDAKRQRRSFLDAGRDQAAFDYLFDVGLVWAYRYDPAKANGVSFPTSVYRRMVVRYPDFLRYGDGCGDPRTGTPLTLVFTDEMPDSDIFDDSFSTALSEMQVGLSDQERWTLHNIAGPAAGFGWTLREAADHACISYEHAQALMDQLAEALRDGYGKPATVSDELERSVAV